MRVTARNRRWFRTADGVRYRGGMNRDGAAQPFDLSDDEIRRYTTTLGVEFDPADEDQADDLAALTDDSGDTWSPVFTADQRANLESAGFTTPAAVREATDDQLTAVEGIGAATVKKFRDAQASELVIR